MIQGKISILMGVYNCGGTLREAIASIQAQSYANWELIVCDDGSKDETFSVAQSLAKEDPRIVLLKNETNLGLNRTLNHCLQAAAGEYIARMDGDDVCDSQRFEKQLRFLEEHPGIDIVSSEMYLFDESGKWGETKRIAFPQPKDIVERTGIAHAPVLMRKKCMDAVGGYSEKRWTQRVEDVDLWIRLYAAGYRCGNISEPLYGMRNDQNAYSRRKYRYRVNSTLVRLRGCRLLHLGLHSVLMSFKPMLIGLIPNGVRRILRKRKGR